MSGKPSHIPIFPDAYLRDNYRLSLEQHGLFLLLMFEAWNQPDCTLPDNDAELAAIAEISEAKFAKISGPVLARWTREGGRIFQKRLRKEWEYVQAKSAKAKASAAQRWQCERNANAMHLGGGEGGGEGSLTKHKVSVGELDGPAPFKIIGGRK